MNDYKEKTTPIVWWLRGVKKVIGIFFLCSRAREKKMREIGKKRREKALVWGGVDFIKEVGVAVEK